MENSRQINDWIVRYGFLLKKRNSDKQKNKFIQAFLTDVLSIRDDINVIEIEDKKKKYHNIYIGDFSKADKIITTYFDTPIVSFGDYSFSDMENNKRNTLFRITIESIFALMVGVAVFFLLNNFFEGTFLTTVLTIFALVFFFVFNRIVKGRADGKTQVRNTSSVITILSLLAKYKKNKKIAFAIVDGGCTNSVGLVTLYNNLKKQSKIFELDCVGVNEKLVLTDSVFKETSLEIYKIHPEMEKISKALLAGKIESDILITQKQCIEKIMEGK